MQRREFHLQDDRSNKFWTIEVDGVVIRTSNGRIGAKPRVTVTNASSAAAALAAAEKEIEAKRRGGYREGPISALPPWRPGLPPRHVRINLDDHHAQYVGRLPDGRQYFLTQPFAPRFEHDAGGQYIALYLFDAYGDLLEARVFDERAEGLLTRTQVDAFCDALLAALGPVRPGDIRVAPFSVERFGRTFGLIHDAGMDGDDADAEDDEATAWVTVEPGNYMAFSAPWDGDYDT